MLECVGGICGGINVDCDSLRKFAQGEIYDGKKDSRATFVLAEPMAKNSHTITRTIWSGHVNSFQLAKTRSRTNPH